MSQSISNLATTGLIPIQNFGGTPGSIGGTSTPLLGSTVTKANPTSPTFNSGASPSSVYTAPAPSTSLTPNNQPLPSSTSQPLSSMAPKTANTGGTPSAGVNSYGLTSASPNWYQLQNGESTSNYYARTQGQTQNQALTGNPGNGGVAGGTLPPSATPTSGNTSLIPLGGTPTINSQGKSTDVQSNVNSGGGTQTNFPSIVGGLASTAATSTPQFQSAASQYNQANDALQQLRSDAAQQKFNIGTSRTNLAESGGEAGLLQNLEAGKESALTGEMNAALGAEQTATGQQGVQQTGLAAAGGLSQPQQAGPTNVSYNPVTGQYGGTAVSAFGANGLQGLGSTLQQEQIGGNVAQLNSYLGGAQVAGSNLQNLISQNNINPNTLTFANGLLQLGQQYVSDPSYAKLPGAVNDFVASIAPILGAGGSITDMKTQMSSQIVNALQSGTTMSQVVSYFLNQAQQKIQGMSTGGGVTVGGSPSSGGANQQSSGGYTFGNFF